MEVLEDRALQKIARRFQEQDDTLGNGYDCDVNERIWSW